MQERPFDYPGSQSEEHYPVAKLIGSVTEKSEDGESFTSFITYRFSKLADIVEIDEFIHDQYPAQRCQHEHDCCGHFYPGRALWGFCRELDRWSSDEEYNQTVIISQRFTCNI